jgi:DnaJ-class molecular chaperone
MAEDLYHTLGVQRGASDDEVRRAYLKLVKELHPDVNPSHAAEERFKKVSAAYEILGDAERRRKYDRGEIDAKGEPRRHQSRAHAGAGFGGARGGFSGFDTEDMFSDIFDGLRGAWPGGARGGFAGGRGQDVRYTLDIEFLESVEGSRRRVTMPGGGVLDLNVPAGVSDGQVLRLKGKGGAGVRGGEAGDALVTINVRPHPVLKRERDDILLEIPITISEAVLGAKIEVPSISGRLQLAVPKGTSSGKVFRLRGKGVHNTTSGATGDQLVTVRIVLPDSIDDELGYFVSEWSKRHPYDPGRRG